MLVPYHRDVLICDTTNDSQTLSLKFKWVKLWVNRLSSNVVSAVERKTVLKRPPQPDAKHTKLNQASTNLRDTLLLHCSLVRKQSIWNFNKTSWPNYGLVCFVFCFVFKTLKLASCLTSQHQNKTTWWSSSSEALVDDKSSIWNKTKKILFFTHKKR